MTNEEMAEILSGAYQKQYHHNDYPELSNNSEFVTSKEEIKEACMYMAAWKEKQMIEKACEKLVEIELEDKDTEDVANEEQDPIYVLNNHFLKKFKQEMEE